MRTIAIAFVLMVLLSMGVSFLIALVGGDGLMESYYGLMAAQAVSSVVQFVVPCLVAFKLTKKGWFDGSFVGKTNGIYAVYAVMMMIVAQPLVSWATWLNDMLYAKPWMRWADALTVDTTSAMRIMLSGESFAEILVGAIVVGILPALCEEFFFRKTLLGSMLKENVSQTNAIVTTSIIFSLMHLDMQGFISRVVLGIVLGFIFCKTGKMRYSVFAHAVNNLAVYFYAISSSERLEETLGAEVENPGVVLPIISVLLVVTFAEGLANRIEDSETK